MDFKNALLPPGGRVLAGIDEGGSIGLLFTNGWTIDVLKEGHIERTLSEIQTLNTEPSSSSLS